MRFFLLWLWKQDWDGASQMVPEWTQEADLHKEKTNIPANLGGLGAICYTTKHNLT